MHLKQLDEPPPMALTPQAPPCTWSSLPTTPSMARSNAARYWLSTRPPCTHTGRAALRVSRGKNGTQKKRGGGMTFEEVLVERVAERSERDLREREGVRGNVRV